MKKRAIPDDFKVSPQIVELAEQNGWSDPHSELDAFRDYHLAHGSRMADWEAAFRTWLRNAKRFRDSQQPQAEGRLSDRTIKILRRGL